MSNKIIDTRQGHWLLSKMGKRVLRPGGRELTAKLITGMNFGEKDEVIEFAPGLGYTAFQVLQKNPHSYTGVELNEEAAQNLSKKISGQNRRIIMADASETGLPDGCADKIYGEAMLTMHADKRKTSIIREAHRLLRPGRLYGIHELSLTPDSMSHEMKAAIQRELSMCIKVNARPLTSREWIDLLESEGFEVIGIHTNGMKLLETRRMIQDEGLFRSVKIGFNILRDTQARKRINEMRCVFNKYKLHMGAIAIIARKL